MSAATAIAANRCRKAVRLADVLHEVGATPDDLTDAVWDAATAAAGVNPPSDDTKAIAVQVLVTYTDARGRETSRLIGAAS